MAQVLSMCAPSSPLSQVPASKRSVRFYDDSAERLAEIYESTTFEAVHVNTLDLLPSTRSAVLDVGSGSGRDAAALARRGYRVMAVEPARGLRHEAIRRHGDSPVHWIDDALPNLTRLESCRFSLILVNAVWMHLAPRDQPDAMRRLTELLEPKGRLVISIRVGAEDPVRCIRHVDIASVETEARRQGLRTIRRAESRDSLAREDVRWVTLVFDKA